MRYGGGDARETQPTYALANAVAGLSERGCAVARAVVARSGRGSRESLETARGVLRELIAAVEAVESNDPSVSVDAAKQQLAEIEALMPMQGVGVNGRI